MKKLYTLTSCFLVVCFLMATIQVKAVDRSGNAPVQKSTEKIQLKSEKVTAGKLTFKEKVKMFREFKKEAKKAGFKKKGTPMVILYILAIILPPVAVGFFTDWGEPTLWNLLFTICFWIPGIIHAFYILLR